MTNARMYGLIAAVCLVAAGILAEVGLYWTASAIAVISMTLLVLMRENCEQ